MVAGGEGGYRKLLLLLLKPLHLHLLLHLHLVSGPASAHAAAALMPAPAACHVVDAGFMEVVAATQVGYRAWGEGVSASGAPQTSKPYE